MLSELFEVKFNCKSSTGDTPTHVYNWTILHIMYY